MSPAPRICCLDLDTFFVSVERLLDPSLEGKPVVVGGRADGRGVVTCASYEVRPLGVHSGISIAEAMRLAPHAIFLPGTQGVYSEKSDSVRRIARRFCPVVQTASIDELYLDFAGCERLLRRPTDPDEDRALFRTVGELLRAIHTECGLPASAGISTSRAVSKVACGLAKPRGVLLVQAGEEQALLGPLPVRKLPGIGPVAERQLAQLGITTIGALARLQPAVLERLMGRRAGAVMTNAQGRGASCLGRDRPAFREHDPRGEVAGSISNERTFFDTPDGRQVERVLVRLCERVCWRARRRGVEARTLSLKLRYTDFHTVTRSCTFPPSSSERVLLPLVRDLYRKARQRPLPIRLLGIALGNLQLPRRQLELFALRDDLQLSQATDAIRHRYGFDAVHLAPGTTHG